MVTRPNCELLPTTDIITLKGKTILLHAWTGPEGSRRLRLLDFRTIGT